MHHVPTILNITIKCLIFTSRKRFLIFFTKYDLQAKVILQFLSQIRLVFCFLFTAINIWEHLDYIPSSKACNILGRYSKWIECYLLLMCYSLNENENSNYSPIFIKLNCKLTHSLHRFICKGKLHTDFILFAGKCAKHLQSLALGRR